MAFPLKKAGIKKKVVPAAKAAPAAKKKVVADVAATMPPAMAPAPMGPAGLVRRRQARFAPKKKY